jgi:hypothetical protein
MPAPPGTMVQTILDRSLQYFQEPKNQERIQAKCIDPLLKHILNRLFPYIILTGILFSLILLLSFTSVGLLIFQLRQSVIAITNATAETVISAEAVPRIIHSLV